MEHTLKEYLKIYNANTIQLVFGFDTGHIINIDTRVKGSRAIINAFNDYTFTFYSYDSDLHLILMY